MKYYIVAILFLVQFCHSFRPEVTLYTEYDYTGTAITLKHKEFELNTLAPRIIDNYKSRCLNGMWVFYSEQNYTSSVTHNIFWSADSVRCSNDTFGALYKGSARYLGPQDTDIRTISLYPETDYRGEEVIVDGPAFANFPFSPKSLFTTGFSNWTLYSGNNFDGDELCFTSTNDYHLMSNVTALFESVQSILRGCA